MAVRLTEYNKCHTPSGADGGQFCSTSGSAAGGAEKASPRSSGREGPAAASSPPAAGGSHTVQPGTDKPRPTPVRVKTVDEALELMRQGQVVEVEDVKTVYTLLTKLAEMALDAKAKGEKAPNYDLCNVSVKGSNLFCTEKIRNAEYPEGVNRIKMPQLTAKPQPGSPADQLPRRAGSESVDASLAFVDYLEAKGIKVAAAEAVPASGLRASQSELLGPHVAGMMMAAGYDPGKDPIFISRDNYVLDGHHRWAAVVGRDAEDGTLGQSTMNVIRIDAPMSELLFEAIDWTARFGLRPKGAYAKEAAFRAQARRGLTFTHRWT